MSLKPCKIYDIRSGSPVLIGDYEAALDFLVKNPDVMEGKAPEAKPATKEAKSPTAKNYVEARDQIAEGAELTKEEVEEELPYFLSQMGLGPLNEKTKNNKAKELFEGLVNLSQEELLDTDSSIAPKIAKWVESVQSESGIKPMSAADKVLAFTASQRIQNEGPINQSRIFGAMKPDENEGGPKSEYRKQLERLLEDLRGVYSDVTNTKRKLKEMEEKNPATARGFWNRIVNGLKPEDLTQAQARLARMKQYVREQKSELRATLPRERGTNFLVEKISRAAREGSLDQETADLALDLLRINPDLFQDVAISITQKKAEDGNTAGWYRAADSMVKIFKNPSDPTTAVHELLHHTERFLPQDVRDNIVKEWSAQVEIQKKALQKSLETERDPKKRDQQTAALLYLALAQELQEEPSLQNKKDIEAVMFKYLAGFAEQGLFTERQKASIEQLKKAGVPITDKIHQGLGQDWYQLFNPSEWWAVNASRIFREARNKPEAKGWVEKAKAFYENLIKAVKRIFKGNPTAAVEEGLRKILKGETLEEKEGYGLSSSAKMFKADFESRGSLWIPLLDALDAAKGDVKKGISDFKAQYEKKNPKAVEQALKYLKANAPMTVRNQINLGKQVEKISTKKSVQTAIYKVFEIGKKEGEVGGKQKAAALMKASLADLKADLSPKQIDGLLNKMAKIKNFSPESMQRFMDYAFNVIDDANYVLQERAAEKVKNRIAKLSNSGTITANDASLFKQFSGLSVGKMTPETLNEFIDWGNKILGKSLQKGDRDAILEWTNTEKDRQDAITAERSAKMKAGRERNLQEEFDRLESEGDLPDGVTTFEEFKEFKKPKSKAETSEQKVEKVSQALSEIDLSEIEDDDNRAIIEALKGLDLSILNAEQLEFTANALNSFIDTGRIFGLGDIVAKAEVWNKIAGLKEDGIKFRKKVDPSDANKLSLTHIFTKFLDVNANAAKVRSAFIQTWLSKSSSAFEDYVKAESALLKLAKKLDIKQENWNRIDLFGFLNEAEGNPELFDNLLEQKKSDLEMLKKSVSESKGDESMSAKGQADRLAALEKAMSLVKGATTLEQVKANLTPYEFTMYDAAREQLDKFAPKAIKNMEAYGNTEVGYIKNYWPRTAKKLGIPKQAVKGELEDFSIYGNDDKLGKNAFGRQKGRSQLLGENGYYEPIGQINLFNGLRETMMVANAAHEYHQMQAVYNNPKGFDQLVSGDGAGELKKLFVDYIADTKNHGRFALDQRGVIKKTWDGLMNSLTSALIKNPTQLLKQPTALGYVAATTPKAMVKASDIASKILIEAISKNEGPYTKAFNKFAKNSTLALRLNIPEIIELSEQYVGDQWVTTEYFKKATKAINDLAGGEAITVGDKATSIIATLSGYIQHKIDVGEIKSASDFDFLKEMSEGIDMDAMSAGEQMQGKTNNENSRLLFSQEQKANSAAYFLTNFTRQAVQNLYINFRKSINPTSTPTERREALAGMGGYVIMALSFQAASAATNAIVNQIAQTMAFGGDDDEEEKLAAIKAYEEARALGRRDGRILQELMSGVAGTQNVLIQASLNFFLSEGFMLAQGISREYAKEYDGELPEIIKSRLKKEYAPLYSNETVGQVGVAAEAFINPLQQIYRAEDRKKKAFQEAMVLGLKIANMGSVAYGANKYYQAESKAVRALKESGTKGEKQIEAKLNPNKEAEEKIKGKIESAINTSDSKALSESFNALMKTSKKTRYQTARDNIFDKIVDDKIRPKSIPEDEASRWIKYIMKGEFADKTVGKGKVKLSELVPANERQEYIKRYMKQAAEVNEKLELMDKALPEAINGKWKDQVFKNAAWRKFVGQKPIKRDVIVEKPVEGGLFKNVKGIIKNIFK